MAKYIYKFASLDSNKKGWRDWEEGAGPPPESGKTISLLPVAAVG